MQTAYVTYVVSVLKHWNEKYAEVTLYWNNEKALTKAFENANDEKTIAEEDMNFDGFSFVERYACNTAHIRHVISVQFE